MRHKTNTITVKQALIIIAMAAAAIIILNIAEYVFSKISNTVENWKKDISMTQENILSAK